MPANPSPPARTNLTAALRVALAGARGGPAPERAGPRPEPRPEPRMALPTPAPVTIPDAAPPIPAPRSPLRILNASGRIFDAALGVPGLADAAIAAMRGAAEQAGTATDAACTLLLELTGAEAALVVGDAATALVLALMAHAAPGGEVVVSRGELWEFDLAAGGGIRVPDLITEAGAQGFEIGSIDRTVAADLQEAVTPATRVLLKLHRPVAIDGAAAELTVAAMAGVARAHRLPVIHALGSGAITADHREPALRDILAAGADLAIFPGDRLLGGPRCGILVGTAAALRPIARLSLARAGHPDARVMAALAATLRLHRDPADAARRIPALRLLGQDRLVLEERAARLQGLLRLPDTTVVKTRPAIGGGVRPGAAPESRAVVLPMQADPLAARLAAQSPSIATTTAANGRLALDVLALADAELGELAETVRAGSQA